LATWRSALFALGFPLHIPQAASGEAAMEFVDRLLTCADCGGEFIFTAGEQLFFFDKQFKNDPKRCKPCKSKRSTATQRAGGGPAAAGLSRTETRTECSECGIETTVPFKPTQGRPVLCRQCFQAKRPVDGSASASSTHSADLIAAAASNAEMNSVSPELVAASAQAPQA
jgi:CxxC-x17-CxxC domain-containing protein